MKWSFSTLGLIMMGIFGILIILLFHEITVSNEQDYYTLKDATNAALIESVDVAYYRLSGEIKISEQKFVENFARRFAETSTFGQGNYAVEYYKINETPAYVSIRIVDATNGYNIYNIQTSTNIVNQLAAILDGYKANSDAVEVFECPSQLPPEVQEFSSGIGIENYTPSCTWLNTSSGLEYATTYEYGMQLIAGCINDAKNYGYYGNTTGQQRLAKALEGTKYEVELNDEGEYVFTNEDSGLQGQSTTSICNESTNNIDYVCPGYGHNVAYGCGGGRDDDPYCDGVEFD